MASTIEEFIASVMHSYLKNNDGCIPPLTSFERDGTESLVWIQASIGRNSTEPRFVFDFIYKLLDPNHYGYDSTLTQSANTAPAAPTAAATEIDVTQSNDCAPSQNPMIHDEDVETKETIPQATHSGRSRKRKCSVQASSACSQKRKPIKTEPEPILPLTNRIGEAAAGNWMAGTPVAHGYSRAKRGGSAGPFKTPQAVPPKRVSTKRLNRLGGRESSTSTRACRVPSSTPKPALPSESSIMDGTPPEYIDGKCSSCNAPFNDRYNFNRHARSNVHNSQKSYHCPICDFETGRDDYLNQHIINKHTVKKEDTSSAKTKGKGKSRKSASKDKSERHQCLRCSHVDGPAGMRKHLAENPDCLEAARNQWIGSSTKQSP